MKVQKKGNLDSSIKERQLSWLEDKTIVFFGDSVTADLRSNYITLLLNELSKYIDVSRVEIVNSGVDSSNILDVTDRVPEILLEYNPDVAVVFVGINDSKIFRSTNKPLISLEQFRIGYSALLDCLDVRGQMTKVIATLPKLEFDEILKNELLADYWYWTPEMYSEYNAVIMEMARCPKCYLADVWKEFTMRNFSLPRVFYNDGVHPNIYGHQLIASAILTALSEFIK